MRRVVRWIPVLVIAALLLWWVREPAPESEQAEEQIDTVVSVHVAAITRADLHAYVTAYGTVEGTPPGGGRPGGTSQIAAPVEELLTEVLAAEGDRVSAGTVLFRLDSRVADAEAARAAAAVHFAEETVARQRTLLPAGGASERSLQEAEAALAARRGELDAARVQQQLRQVRAPFAGTIVRIHTRPGEAVQKGTVLAEMENADRLVVTVGVPATEVGAVHAGALTELSGDGRVLGQGTVEYVSPQVDPATGLAAVRVSARPGLLRRGQFVRARIVTEERRERLTVPVAGVVRTSDGSCEIAVVDGDMARRVPVTCGLREDDRVEIEGDGLDVGMQVVTAGVYGLPAESRIRIVGQ